MGDPAKPLMLLIKISESLFSRSCDEKAERAGEDEDGEEQRGEEEGGPGDLN